MKRTGPIDNTSLYKQVKAMGTDDAVPTIFTLDDPYW